MLQSYRQIVKESMNKFIRVINYFLNKFICVIVSRPSIDITYRDKTKLLSNHNNDKGPGMR